MADLLFEIGTEELPAGFILPALERLSENFVKKVQELQVEAGKVRVVGTPRRLSLLVHDLAERQSDRREELMGPSVQAGLDQDGGFTKAAIGFARSKGAEPIELRVVTTARGDYLMLVRELAGVPTMELLPGVLHQLLVEFSFPKAMRWGVNTHLFARPVQWLLALFGREVVHLSLDGLISSRYSRGHRFMAPAPIAIDEPASYQPLLAQASVLVDPAVRRQRVLDEINQAVAGTSGLDGARVAVDDILVDTVTNLVECPFGVCGRFEERFLALPEEVLITSMREHQKYFPVVDRQGRLLPCFVAVNNTRVEEEALTRQGHERVLRARLEDAWFFFGADRQRRLEDRYPQLSGIIFQARLGTMLEKSERLIALAGWLAEKLAPEDLAVVQRAARLCKVDLLTSMVGEFPSLQGDMGAEYAVCDGEPIEVARAIREHYLPKRAGAALPHSAPGAIVGLADRLDTMVGCFGIGQQPTGATDPFGLRRLSLALIHIVSDRGYCLSLREAIDKALSLYGDRVDAGTTTVETVLAFIKGRFVNDAVARGLDQGAVEAVSSLGFDDINDCRKKIDALIAIRHEQAFSVLAAAFKRIRNIIKGHHGGDIVPELLVEEAERRLAKVYGQVQGLVHPLLEKKEYKLALTEMLALKEPVDHFFDSVMVMADDEQVRINRLNLLVAIAGLFLRVGDISRMTVS